MKSLSSSKQNTEMVITVEANLDDTQPGYVPDGGKIVV